MAPDSSDYVADFATVARVDPAGTCLVLVDFQNALGRRDMGLGRILSGQGRLAEADYRFGRIERTAVPNAARLLRAFREQGLERLFLTVGSERPDWSDLPGPLRGLCRAVGARAGQEAHEILPGLAPRAGETVLNKTSLSAFNSTPAAALLRERGAHTLAFTGLTTNMCVEHTLRDAADLGFSCLLVEDACAADSPEMHEAAVRNVRRLYGAVTTTAELLESVAPALAASGVR